MSIQAIYRCPLKEAEKNYEEKQDKLREAIESTSGRDVYIVDFKNKKLIDKKHYKADTTQEKQLKDTYTSNKTVKKVLNRLRNKELSYRHDRYLDQNKIS